MLFGFKSIAFSKSYIAFLNFFIAVKHKALLEKSTSILLLISLLIIKIK